jgi:hypothetical protein
VLKRHVRPVLGKLAPADIQPAHIDHVLTRIVAAGAPTVANDALRHMSRMFRMAVRNQWIDRNPAADFELLDAGGEERARERWLTSRPSVAAGAFAALARREVCGPADPRTVFASAVPRAFSRGLTRPA